MMASVEKIAQSIHESPLISRDLSWLQFNYRVLDQAKHEKRNVFERMKFLAITASNLDEFFMIRVGSLYNYLDYGKERVDYSGLREGPFRKLLLERAHQLFKEQRDCYHERLAPLFESNGFQIANWDALSDEERLQAKEYFEKTVFPMLTPMAYDAYHAFPMLMNKLLIFGVVTYEQDADREPRKLSFVQVPANLPRFFEIDREEQIVFVPIEEIIRANIEKLYRNIEILYVSLFRITRNGDFTLEESDDMETAFIEEVKRKLKSRRTGRVVRLEIQPDASKWMLRQLKARWEIDDMNVFETGQAPMDFTGLWQIVKHDDFKTRMPASRKPVLPVTLADDKSATVFQQFRKRDVLLHHPFNSTEPLLKLIEAAAEDPKVLAIKMTIYRLAKESRITAALLKAAENGKHVSVLFEVKARFDEENNIREAQKLQQAGCFVIYGVSNLKTHSKLLLIVRNEGEKVTRYVHLASGNYNEDTAKLYMDIGLITTDEEYAQDVSDFFNAITGHSRPRAYDRLLTAPHLMREALIALVRQEASNAKEGKPSGIIIKVNSLQDKSFINALYEASEAGVPIQLIIRGICSLRPGRKGLSEKITVRSLVGDLLEHSRVFYFHNAGKPKVYSGSADAMVRSFDRRIESMFLITDERCRKEAINLLYYNLRDDVNAYLMLEDGSYAKVKPKTGTPFNSHVEFYNLTPEIVDAVKVF